MTLNDELIKTLPYNICRIKLSSDSNFHHRHVYFLFQKHVKRHGTDESEVIGEFLRVLRHDDAEIIVIGYEFEPYESTLTTIVTLLPALNFIAFNNKNISVKKANV